MEIIYFGFKRFGLGLRVMWVTFVPPFLKNKTNSYLHPFNTQKSIAKNMWTNVIYKMVARIFNYYCAM